MSHPRVTRQLEASMVHRKQKQHPCRVRFERAQYGAAGLPAALDI
jgi:hypothetical protein